MRYPNLVCLMLLRGVGYRRMALLMGMSRNSFYNKLHGRTQFTVREAKRVQRLLSPHDTLDTIFADTPTLLGQDWR